MSQLLQKNLMEMFFSVLRLIFFFPQSGMNNFRNNEKHKKHSGVFLWSSDKQPPHTRPRRACPGALNTSDRAWFYYPWDYETVSVLLFTNFTPPPLNRWANGAKPGEVTAVSLIPLGTAIFARKTLSVVKIFNSGSKWRISGTGRCHLGSLAAHSWAALRNIPLTLLR